MQRGFLISICALAALTACGDDLSDVSGFLDTYGAIAEAEVEDSLTAAQALDARAETFLEAPDAAGLEATRDAWRAAREPYLQTEAYRYYGGPIEQGTPEHEISLNAWPIDESVIDYVHEPATGESLRTGIVNDPSVTIDGPALRVRNEMAGETAITTGYHPIEFLLWGQDDPDVEGAGQRPFTDYVTDGTGDENAERRAAYLRVALELVQDDLSAVLAEWRDEPGTYRRAMVEGDPRAGLRDVLTGLAEMSGPELANSRIGVALFTRDQEDEHSCFSDNTHREIYLDALGIQNVYLGRYERTDGTVVSGPGLTDLVAARDAALDARMREQLEESVSAADAIGGPFDELILSMAGRERLNRVTAALQAQVATLGEIARLFGIELAVE